MIDKERLCKLTQIAEEYAGNPGFATLQNSIAGARLAIASLSGHLMLSGEINDSELLGIIIALQFIDELEK